MLRVSRFMSEQVKRKIHYIDADIQNRLLVSFVLLEVLLVGAGMAVLYLNLKEVIDESLFSAHLAARESLFMLLLREAMQTLAVLFLANLSALGLTKWLWLRYLDASILRPLSGLVARTGRLDFAPDETLEQRHSVLDLALAWRKTERARSNGIHAEISRLDENAGYSSAGELEKTRATLENLKALLPVHTSESRSDPD